MKFKSTDPSVVKSITPRVLLNAWLRAPPAPSALPLL
jgi:hypothetical protein